MRKLALLISGCFLLSPLYVGTVSAHDKTGTTAKAPATLTGCLSGPYDEGSYKLKTSTREVVVGGSIDDLKSRAGHQVKVTGKWVPSQAPDNEKEAAGLVLDTERHFAAARIRTVSDKCS